jgi:hypothetical protein
MMTLPQFYRIRQVFGAKAVENVTKCVREQFEGFDAADRIRPGQSVAVAVASRGTHDLKILVKTVIDCLKDRDLKPHIIPAMGSHGGATGEGQARVLKDLGISETTMGVPVISNMDVVSLGRLESGAQVFFSKDALAADHIVIVNRVKPHTAFRGQVESGLCKMLAVGCGKQRGASHMHKYDLSETIVPAAQMILEKTPVLCGLAVTETPTGGTHAIRLAKPEAFVQLDTALLKEAWTLLPRIPIDDLDILVVDELGKDISGAGMDPNVIGFWRREGGQRKPDYRTLVVLDLTRESHGNATGIGMADLTTKRFMDKVDVNATYMNALTSGVLRSARMPICLENDRAAVETALEKVPHVPDVRIARIRNTLSLESFWASDALLPELREKDGISIDSHPVALDFDRNNRLLPMG